LNKAAGGVGPGPGGGARDGIFAGGGGGISGGER